MAVDIVARTMAAAAISGGGGGSSKKTLKTFHITWWGDLTDCEPYDYYSVKPPQYTLTDKTVARLINDQPVLFANYGFAIGVLNVASQTITFYSIGQPTAAGYSDVALKVEFYDEN